ncbi:YdeI/OmpD-associated family protein, partial [Cellulosimicrobium cellulans]|nr:YdeI/OmpD-associated family protein [Cellulosimicrobium cellulans]
WIVEAKRPDTRARRIAETAELAEQGVAAHQPRR